MQTVQQVLQEVLAERVRQETKWGQQNHNPFRWNAILGEEVGEVSNALCENWNEKKELYPHLREELIQVAAVAVAFVESLDRNQLIENPIP